jgi:hypothetical protein
MEKQVAALFKCASQADFKANPDDWDLLLRLLNANNTPFLVEIGLKLASLMCRNVKNTEMEHAERMQRVVARVWSVLSVGKCMDDCINFLDNQMRNGFDVQSPDAFETCVSLIRDQSKEYLENLSNVEIQNRLSKLLSMLQANLLNNASFAQAVPTLLSLMTTPLAPDVADCLQLLLFASMEAHQDSKDLVQDVILELMRIFRFKNLKDEQRRHCLTFLAAIVEFLPIFTIDNVQFMVLACIVATAEVRVCLDDLPEGQWSILDEQANQQLTQTSHIIPSCLRIVQSIVTTLVEIPDDATVSDKISDKELSTIRLSMGELYLAMVSFLTERYAEFRGLGENGILTNELVQVCASWVCEYAKEETDLPEDSTHSLVPVFLDLVKLVDNDELVIQVLLWFQSVDADYVENVSGLWIILSQTNNNDVRELILRVLIDLGKMDIEEDVETRGWSREAIALLSELKRQ